MVLIYYFRYVFHEMKNSAYYIHQIPTLSPLLPGLVYSWAYIMSFLKFSSAWILYFGPNRGIFSTKINQ